MSFSPTKKKASKKIKASKQEGVAMRVLHVDQLFDNYAYLLIDEAAAVAAAVDVAEADSVLAAASEAGVSIKALLCTHHHFDHVGGNEALIGLLGDPGLEVFGYAGDAARIPGITHPLADGESFEIAGLRGCSIFIPAHTSGHLAYYFESQGVVFTGDTLFAGGCGRVFEGDAAQMKASLDRLAALPDSTKVYCGHEYTQQNLDFALSVEPGNQALQERVRAVAELREAGKPTLPTTIALEKQTNPFLRCNSEELRASLAKRFPGLSDDPVEIFAAARRLKDDF